MIKLTPFRISVLFAFFSFCWIYFSDVALSSFTKDPELYTRISIAKGWLYMLLTSIFLYVLISLYGKQKNRAEEALRESGEKFRNLFNNSEIAMFRTRLDGSEVLDVNQKFLDLVGRTREETVGKPSKLLWADAKVREEMVQRLIAEGRVSQLEFQMLNKQGSVRDCITSLVLYREQGILEGSIQDITERKRAEEALRESQNQFRRVVENSPLSMALVSLDGVIEYINHKAVETFGYLQQDIPDMDHWWVQAYPDKTYRDEVIAQWMGLVGEARLHNHEIEKREYRVTCKNGSVKTMAIFGVWIADKVLVVFDDVTEKHLLEEERLKTQKLESIGTLAGGIAHDFNNLLQGVFGYISLAKMAFDQKEKSLSMLEQAEAALHLSVNLTTQLLTFSKGGKPVKKLIRIGPAVENAVKFALSGSNANYTMNVLSDLWPVEADEGQLSQVVQNIVLNANEAMAGSGTVHVSIGNMDIARNTISGLPDGGQFVRIVIQDSGVGIKKQNLTRIFDPYFTTKQRGSGLGLATSYSIIKNHGGVVKVISELNKGTVFEIYLPASKIAETATVNPHSAAVGTKKGRILLMDDEALVRGVAKEMILAIGHEVEEAEDGSKAIELLRQAREAGRPFDLVILDLTVKGGMGGEEAIAKMREIDPDVRAVVSSGYADSPVLADYRAYGFSAVLNKPYMTDSLKDCLNPFFS